MGEGLAGFATGARGGGLISDSAKPESRRERVAGCRSLGGALCLQWPYDFGEAVLAPSSEPVAVISISHAGISHGCHRSFLSPSSAGRGFVDRRLLAAPAERCGRICARRRHLSDRVLLAPRGHDRRCKIVAGLALHYAEPRIARIARMNANRGFHPCDPRNPRLEFSVARLPHKHLWQWTGGAWNCWSSERPYPRVRPLDVGPSRIALPWIVLVTLFDFLFIAALIRTWRGRPRVESVSPSLLPARSKAG